MWMGWDCGLDSFFSGHDVAWLMGWWLYCWGAKELESFYVI